MTWEELEATAIDGRTCKTCKTWKPLESGFYMRNGRKSRLCKRCEYESYVLPKHPRVYPFLRPMLGQGTGRSRTIVITPLGRQTLKEMGA